MTDRELLEAAARAAGIVGDLTFSPGATPWLRESANLNRPWNPLADDGDEARLESALLLHVEWHPANREVLVGTAEVRAKEPWGDDKQQARRRAGVRAAAAMDMAPPQEQTP